MVKQRTRITIPPMELIGQFGTHNRLVLTVLVAPKRSTMRVFTSFTPE